MYKKKPALLITALMLISILFTGCGTTTLGFFTHLDEMQKVAMANPTQTTSTVSIRDISYPEDLVPTEQKVIVRAIQTFLTDYSIVSTQKLDPNQNITSISIDTLHKQTNKRENLATFNFKDKAFAVSVGPKFKELLAVAPEDIKATVAAFDNKLIPETTLKQLFGDQYFVIESMGNYKNLSDLNDKSMSSLKDFMKVYDLDLITKKDNSYVFDMNVQGLVKFIDTFVLQTIDHKDAILAATIKFYESLTPEQYNALYGGMLGSTKEETIAMLNEAVKEPIPEGTKEMWQETYKTDLSPMLISLFDGSSVRMRTWKDNGNYYTNLYSILKISDPGDLNKKYTATILQQEEVTVLKESFNVTMPTEVISQEFVDSIIQASQIEQDSIIDTNETLNN